MIFIGLTKFLILDQFSIQQPSRFHKNQTLAFKNGLNVQRQPTAGPGGRPLAPQDLDPIPHADIATTVRDQILTLNFEQNMATEGL